MSDERKTIECSAETIEAAIKEGLEKLGVSEREVEIEILEEAGRGGIFGLGSRMATVRLTVLDVQTVQTDETEQKDTEAFPIEADDLDNVMSIARETVLELLTRMEVEADVS